MRKLFSMVCLLAPLAFACGDAKSTDSGSGDGDGDGESGSDDSTTGGGANSSDECDMYLECIDKVDPNNAPAAHDLFDPDGTCWMNESAADCSDDCKDFTDSYVDDFPNALECGGDPLCPGQCCEKKADCNPDFPCCDGTVCFQQGADRCNCLNLPEECTTCTNDCLANMVPPDTCEQSCKYLCEPDLDTDPIGCRTWPDP